ncbi:MAG: F0F1 ATP synthase subunit A [Oscillospiraceae bacterium]|jgi:F-type H+-transporting ATPase subunit a|nr:F0F1 ATP synthase subunit A [Oscillospiraceae bacterium]
MNIEGARILFTLPILGGIKISETTVVSWGVVVFLIILIKIFVHKMETIPKGKQVLVEEFVRFIEGQVEATGGKKVKGFAPYIGAIFLMSITSSLCGLVGARPPTADLSITAAWAVVTFVLILFVEVRSHGVGGYLKGFLKPFPVMLPMNIIEMIVLPVSMAARHFCNILSAVILVELLGSFLASVSGIIFGALGSYFPILKVGLPAVFSIYLDLFGSFIQAFVFITLTLVNLGRATSEEE